ncbi:hypothetical protein [Mangrovicoccus ximenensis]|uniref:hypothetical protein n=1 Tax=Mangrovicoccus ximenensis TaxID=1911570 RepID=UPI000D391785|nr:hypothetical protein [Mangrovicoccus ximenensis]
MTDTDTLPARPMPPLDLDARAAFLREMMPRAAARARDGFRRWQRGIPGHAASRTGAPGIDLSAIPGEQRAAVALLMRRVGELEEAARRREHPIRCPAVHCAAMSREGPS